MVDHAFLKGIEVMACHGVHEAEQHTPQRFIVDVYWWLDLEKYARADDYAKAVCYEEVFRTAVGILSGPPVRLIEKLSISIIDALLERFGAIRMVKVSVRKPDAPLPGPFADVGVSMIRRRPDD
ncbi:MAG: dihydroneopterin aldolase [Proteobacteria bacterium]|nr:dihydroneopterin aldolase [Pseudomonadota bacterium]